MTNRTIECVEDAIKLVRWGSGVLSDLNSHIEGYQAIFPRGTWFRGQDNHSWPLVPTVFRQDKSGKRIYAQSEGRILRDFQLRHADRSAQMLDTLDWLCLMQHHGCPTRILDWTENVLIGLYFAVMESEESRDVPGALFVLNAFKLNHHTAGGPTELRAGDLPCWFRAQLAEDSSFNSLLNQATNERPGDLPQLRKDVKTRKSQMATHFSRPVAVWPRIIHERMSRQQSVFVVHGGTYSPESKDFHAPAMLEQLQTSIHKTLHFLVKFTVPVQVKKPIRDELRCLGIHVASLFPELQYQAEYIRHAWRIRP